MKKVFLVFTLTIFVFTTIAVAGPPSEVWNVTYESGGNDHAYGVATDASGNVYVTGIYGDLGVDAACRTIKYDTDGNVLWNKLYDDYEACGGLGVAVDGAGNVYVAGAASDGGDFDYLLIKYNADGDVLWSETWGGGNDDVAQDVATNFSGDVYITGYTDNGVNEDFRTIKYDSDGNLQWGQSHDEFSGDDEAYGVALDASGNVYVTGWTHNGANSDFLTLKYDSDGDLQWSEVRDENFADAAHDVDVDGSGDVYVTGYSADGGGDFDYLTVKYNTDGGFQWKERYGGEHFDEAWGIAVDQFFVYVAGAYSNGVDNDFLTIRYDKEGNFGWEMFFDSGDQDYALGLAVDDFHYVYVTGYHDVFDIDFRTIKYEQDDIPSVAETPAATSLTLEIIENFSAAPTIHYAIPRGMHGLLSLYSVDGRLLESYSLDPVQSQFSWITDSPSGVYFAMIVSENTELIQKVVLIK